MQYARQTVLIPLAATLFLCAACSKNGNRSSDGDEEIVPVGSQTDGPKIATVDYDDLGWSSDETFTIGDKPFSGIAVQKHDDGKVKGKYDLVEGRFDGSVQEWYENGVRSTSKMYKGGKRHGVTTYWDEAGDPIKVVVYENDEEVETITDPEVLKKIPK